MHSLHQDPRCRLLDHAGISRGAFCAAYGVCAGRCGGRRKGLRPLRPLPLDQAGLKTNSDRHCRRLRPEERDGARL